MIPRLLSLSRKRVLLVLLALSFTFILYTNYVHLNPLVTSLPSSFRNGTSPPVTDASFANDLPGERNTRVLLVSAFFPIANTTFTIRDYAPQLKLFLSQITADVYFFTAPEYESLIRGMRGSLPISINTTFTQPFDIPPLQKFRGDYKRMTEHDRERSNRSPDFYAFMNAKPYFLKEGLSIARQKSKPNVGPGYRYAFWIDPGTFRENHAYRIWPDPRRLDSAWSEAVKERQTNPRNLMFFPLVGLPHPTMSMWSQDIGPIQAAFSDPTFYGGSPSAVYWWHDIYYAHHDYWVQRKAFVGRDHAMTNALMLMYSTRIFGLWPKDPEAPVAKQILSSYDGYDKKNPPPRYLLASPLGQCLDDQAYHVYFFASYDERAAMDDKWMNKKPWLWPWQWINQLGRPKYTCTLTRVLELNDFLKSRAFGQGWKPPRGKIIVSSH